MNKPLKILFLSNRGLLPINDGHTRRSFNILKGLTEKNHVYFLSLYEAENEINPNNIKILESFCEKVEFIKSPTKKLSIEMIIRLIISLLSLDPYTIWRHYSLQLIKRTNELISSGYFDIVHCDILPLVYLIRKRKDVFRSITDHDVSYIKCLRIGKETKNILLKLFLFLETIKIKRLESNIFKKIDLGIVVSEFDRELLKGLCPEGNFVVIENGVESEKFIQSDEPTEPNKLVWLGGFNPYSNREAIYYFFEKIYPMIKCKNNDVKIDIIGGRLTDKLRNIADNDSSINLCGYVDDPLPIIQKASVFIAPILSGGGTKLKILEAMSVAKAIVTTSIGCEGINGKNREHYIIADNSDEFAMSVNELLKDKLFRKRLGLNARKLVEMNYDYKAICKKLNYIYESEINK
jgi:polysaccharide biosynthesis protein PslH